MSVQELDCGTGKLRNVRLYGRLGARFGRVHRMAVSSAAEAVRALCSQREGFETYLTNSKDRGEGYGVFYGKKNLTVDQLTDDTHDACDIRIAPITIGSKNGGWVNIIIGAILVIVGVMGWFFSAGTSSALVVMGWGMIIGGVVQLLTPGPKGISSKDRPENMPSYSFNGPINTQAQGNPVQVQYGQLHIGSAVLSAGINAVDQAIIPDTSGGSGHGPRGGGGFSNFDTITP